MTLTYYCDVDCYCKPYLRRDVRTAKTARELLLSGLPSSALASDLVGFLAEDGKVADATRLGFDELFALYEYAAGAAAWVVHAAFVKGGHGEWQLRPMATISPKDSRAPK